MIGSRRRAVNVRVTGPVIRALIICSLLYACTSSPEARDEFPTRPIEDGRPIILVHGFGGWGRDDIANFYYWGGLQDLQTALRKEGYSVFTASMGPFSSNWDRACELYAFLVGGKVDYGEYHAEKHGHERFGQAYVGVYPEMSEDRKIHLIGHSMGGQVARLLAHFLRHGDEGERNLSGDSCSPLFAGLGQYVASITTLSTPHNGTTLAYDVELIDSLIDTTRSAVSGVIENSLFPDFDLRAEHWGITREISESIESYFARLRDHPIWTAQISDFSIWDASPAGAAELNKLAPADPEIFYFSYANEETTKTRFMGFVLPEVTMFALLVPMSIYMGSYNNPNNPLIDDSWWENDGVVNTVSMKGPFFNSDDPIEEYDGTPKRGIWNYMGVLSSIDHTDILGIPNGNVDVPEGYESIIDFYSSLCRFISELP